MADDYKPIVTDSNFSPIGVVVRRDGKLVDLVNYDVTVTVRDPSSRTTIVNAGAATVVGPGRADFYFSAEQVALITRDSTWLCEWCFYDQSSGRTLRRAPLRLPVTAKLSVV